MKSESRFIATCLLLTAAFPCAWLHAQQEQGSSPEREFRSSARQVLGTESNRTASVRIGDLDGDGDLDVVAANGRHWPQQNFLFFNQGNARFNVMAPLGADRRTTYACELADLDGDGDLDIVTGNDMALGKIFLNDGAGKFTEHSEYGTISSVRSLTLADIDNDNDIDILATSRGRPNQIYLNDGAANFSDGPQFGNRRDSTIAVAVADLNGDGNQDLILANRDRQPNEVRLGSENLDFSSPPIPFGDPTNNSRAVAIVDLDGDGNLDWAVGNIGAPNQIFLGDGDGKVKSSIEFGQPDGRTYSLAIADLNNDGRLDLVTGNNRQQNFAYFNDGSSDEQAVSFRPVPFGDAESTTYGLSVGKLTGSGFADIVVANSDENNRVLLNRPATDK